MAVHGLIALLDDIATLADDVAHMTALGTKKAAGVVTDDMAVTAERMVGIRRERELPIVWAVGKGSLANKLLILVPAALFLSAFAPWALTPLLMLGGAFLCFEGAEKVFHAGHGHEEEEDSAIADKTPESIEKERVSGAIKTDFILSAEIIVIALKTVSEQPFLTQVLSLIVISISMTVGVYGLVALLIRMDDMGLALTQRADKTTQKIGRALLWIDPKLIRAIAAIGTMAMLMVGGGILIHGTPPLYAAQHHLEELVTHYAGGFANWLAVSALTALVGLLAGWSLMHTVQLAKKLRGFFTKSV